MQPPQKKPSDLRHPKEPVKTWNGDLRRPDDQQGFMKANRVRTVEGTRPASNLREVNMPVLGKAPDAESRDMTGAGPINPYPADHCFTPAFQPDLEALKAHQVQMLKNNKTKKK